MVQLYREPAARAHHRAEVGSAKAGDWKTRAVAAYSGRVAGPAAELAQAINELTDRAIGAEQIWADQSGATATALLDGERFRREGGQLVLLRPCAHCGTGLLASPPLRSRSDLGYALAGWQPLHPGCQAEDPADW
ncbi:MAG TPA: hypothetical protein PKD53_15280 [Chloroflexaceae bacterium]|nr:hypothetical protein [Chloroflexaceae bacterium]